LRGLAPRRRLARGDRRRLAAHRAVRVLDPAAQLGRPRAGRPRRRTARDRPARDDARRPDHRRTDLPRRRPAAALRQRARALPQGPCRFIRILRAYGRGVVFRLGRLLEPPKGPGVVFLIPIVDRIVKVDLRTITLNIPPQEVITKDNVPARVNAVAYFRIVDP